MTLVPIRGWLADFHCECHTPLAALLKPCVSDGGSQDLSPLPVPSGVNGLAGAGQFSEPQVPTTLIGSCEEGHASGNVLHIEGLCGSPHLSPPWPFLLPHTSVMAHSNPQGLGVTERLFTASQSKVFFGGGPPPPRALADVSPGPSLGPAWP